MDTYNSKQNLSGNSLLNTTAPVSHAVSKTEIVPNLDARFPPKPVEPQQEDCCGQGCQPCIFDIYQEQLVAWEAECKRLQSVETKVGAAEVISIIQWSPFICVSMEPEAVGVNIYTFEHVRYKNSLNFYPGQYLVAQNGRDFSVMRAYTPLPSKVVSQFCVLVKLYEDGQMSEFWKHVYPGEEVLWKGPYETGYHYVANSHSHLLMFCAGTGVAPCYALACCATSNELDVTFVRIIFTCRTRYKMLLREPLRQLRQYWNFTSRTLLTQDDGVGLNKWYGEDVISGRITLDVVISELAGKPSPCVIICGTRSFNKDLCGYVRQCGVREEDTKVW